MCCFNNFIIDIILDFFDIIVKSNKKKQHVIIYDIEYLDIYEIDKH